MFDNNQHQELFRSMLEIRFKRWVKNRKNLLARQRYREKKRIDQKLSTSFPSWK